MFNSNPVHLKHTHTTAPASGPEKAEQTSKFLNVVLDGDARSFIVSNYGGDSAEQYLFPELKPALTQPWINASAYEKAVARLSSKELTALREWTALDTAYDADPHYSDGATAITSGLNYELNQKLAYGKRLTRHEIHNLQAMDAALAKLPRISGELLRIAEHSNDRPPPWLSKINVGDVVTNAPCFMSAAIDHRYAEMSLVHDEFLNPDSTNAVAIYKIDTSPALSSAVPLLRGALSLADEGEVLFGRSSCFQVKSISVADPYMGLESDVKRIAIHLVQVPPQPAAANLFSGNTVSVST